MLHTHTHAHTHAHTCTLKSLRASNCMVLAPDGISNTSLCKGLNWIRSMTATLCRGGDSTTSSLMWFLLAPRQLLWASVATRAPIYIQLQLQSEECSSSAITKPHQNPCNEDVTALTWNQDVTRLPCVHILYNNVLMFERRGSNHLRCMANDVAAKMFAMCGMGALAL